MMAASVEKKYDDFEIMAQNAMMSRAAYHAKKLNSGDLFTRPVDAEVKKKKVEKAKSEVKDINKLLSSFEEFKDADLGEF